MFEASDFRLSCEGERLGQGVACSVAPLVTQLTSFGSSINNYSLTVDEYVHYVKSA